VIARAWSAQARPERAPAYAAHLREHVLPALRRLEGYAGAELLEREVSGSIEITVLTYWRSLDSIRAFAGADIESAVVADEAAAVLTSFDRHVRHYEVVVEDGPMGRAEPGRQ
jgi:heme-degrading monooxygenase HmoA